MHLQTRRFKRFRNNTNETNEKIQTGVFIKRNGSSFHELLESESRQESRRSERRPECKEAHGGRLCKARPVRRVLRDHPSGVMIDLCHCARGLGGRAPALPTVPSRVSSNPPVIPGTARPCATDDGWCPTWTISSDAQQ